MATVHLPEALAHRLRLLAEQEGTTVDGLIQWLVSEHTAIARPAQPARKAIRLPLISYGETGPIQPVTGADLDEIFALDDLAS